jgi:cell shape-determining protein MreD
VPHNEASENGAAETVSVESGSETVLGISLENPWVVTAFVIGWLALLIALFLLGRPALILILIAALASAFFDIAEVLQQISRSNSLVASIAVLVALAHLAIAVLAGMALTGRIPPVLARSTIE